MLKKLLIGLMILNAILLAEQVTYESFGILKVGYHPNTILNMTLSGGHKKYDNITFKDNVDYAMSPALSLGFEAGAYNKGWWPDLAAGLHIHTAQKFAHAKGKQTLTDGVSSAYLHYSEDPDYGDTSIGLSSFVLKTYFWLTPRPNQTQYAIYLAPNASINSMSISGEYENAFRRNGLLLYLGYGASAGLVLFKWLDLSLNYDTFGGNINVDYVIAGANGRFNISNVYFSFGIRNNIF